MAKGYRFEGDYYADDSDGRRSLAQAIIQSEAGAYDYEFEQYVDSHERAMSVLWQVKEWGYDDTMITLWDDFVEWYVEENLEDILHDYSNSYEVVNSDPVPDEEIEEEE